MFAPPTQKAPWVKSSRNEKTETDANTHRHSALSLIPGYTHWSQRIERKEDCGKGGREEREKRRAFLWRPDVLLSNESTRSMLVAKTIRMSGCYGNGIYALRKQPGHTSHFGEKRKGNKKGLNLRRRQLMMMWQDMFMSFLLLWCCLQNVSESH